MEQDKTCITFQCERDFSDKVRALAESDNRTVSNYMRLHLQKVVEREFEKLLKKDSQ